MGGVGFYSHIEKRGGETSGKSGSSSGGPGSAMNYLQDDHDSRKVLQVSADEQAYIQRLGEGVKTDLEGGRLPLVGYGKLAGLPEDLAREKFEWDCSPRYTFIGSPQPTPGYISWVATPPKEVSLFCATNPDASRRVFQKAVDRALAGIMRESFGEEIRFSAVSAIHTRNANGEVHYHAHVLISKFAESADKVKEDLNPNGRFSLSARGTEQGVFKRHWTEAFVHEFKKEFGVTIEQRADGKAILHMPDGTSVHPLNRASRREIEKAITPTYTTTLPDGSVRTSKLTLNVMDQKIFEVASLKKGRLGWNPEVFKEVFPGEARRVESFEKRISTLRQVGYLSEEGRVTQAFRTHYEIKWGKDDPQLQLLRNDLARGVRVASIEGRLERLGVTQEDLSVAPPQFEDWKAKLRFQLDEARAKLVSLDDRFRERLGETESLDERSVVLFEMKKEREALEKEIDRLSTRLRIDKVPTDLRGEHRALKVLEEKIQALQSEHQQAIASAQTPEEHRRIELRFGRAEEALRSSYERIQGALEVEHAANMERVALDPSRDANSPFTKETGRYIRIVGASGGGDRGPGYQNDFLAGLLKGEQEALRGVSKALLKERNAALRGGIEAPGNIRDQFRDPILALRQYEAALGMGSMELRMDSWPKMPEEKRQEILSGIRSRIESEGRVSDLKFEAQVARMERWSQSWEAPTFLEQEKVHSEFDDKEIVIGHEISEAEEKALLAKFGKGDDPRLDAGLAASNERLEALQSRLALDKEIRAVAHETRMLKVDRHEAMIGAGIDREASGKPFKDRMNELLDKRDSLEKDRLKTFFQGQKNGLGSPVHRGSLERLEMRQEIRREREGINAQRERLGLDRREEARLSPDREAREVVHQKFDTAERELASRTHDLDRREIASRGDLKPEEKEPLLAQAAEREKGVSIRQEMDREIRATKDRLLDLKDERSLALQDPKNTLPREEIRSKFENQIGYALRRLDSLEEKRFTHEYSLRQWGPGVDSEAFKRDLQALHLRQEVRTQREDLNVQGEILSLERRDATKGILDRSEREQVHDRFDRAELDLAGRASDLDRKEIASRLTLEPQEREQALEHCEIRLASIEERQGADKAIRALDDRIEDTREAYFQRIAQAGSMEIRQGHRAEQQEALEPLIRDRDDLEVRRMELRFMARSERPTGIEVQESVQALRETQECKRDLRTTTRELEDLRDQYYSSSRNSISGDPAGLKAREIEVLGKIRDIEIRMAEARSRLAPEGKREDRLRAERSLAESKHQVREARVRDRQERGLGERIAHGLGKNLGRRALASIAPEMLPAYKAVKRTIAIYKMLREKPIPMERLERVRIGLNEAMRQGGKDAALLRPWKGREDRLVAAVDSIQKPNGGLPTVSKVTVDAAQRAEAVGTRILEAEMKRGSIQLTSTFEPYRKEIENLNARFRAFGMEEPLDAKRLSELSPKGLQDVLKDPKTASILTKDASWASMGGSAVAQAHIAVLKKVAEKVADKVSGLVLNKQQAPTD